MRACGIVSEYNPFHNGHLWHIQETRRQLQADVIIAVMSGQFTQRGELACVSKWQRAQAALQHGVDIVVELPSLGAIQAADYFAKDAIRILAAMQCEFVSCGVEQGTADVFIQMAQLLHANEQEVLTFLQQQDKNQTYTHSMQLLLKKYMQTDMTFGPNNILALSYARAIVTQQAPMTFVTIPRQQAQHGQQIITTNQTIASGTAIRDLMYQQKDYTQYVPCSYDTQYLPNMTKFWSLLQYVLCMATPEQLRVIYQMDEGIEFRVIKCAKEAHSYEDFMTRLQHKRWKVTRLQRLMLYVLAQVSRELVDAYMQQPVKQIRLLGATTNGRRYLKEHTQVDYLTHLKKEHYQDSFWHKQAQFDQLYQLLATGSVIEKYPIIIEER